MTYVQEFRSRLHRSGIGSQPRRVTADSLSRVLLATIFIAYLVRWTFCHAGFLIDPALQNDDARTALFPFHRYADNPAFAQDPIAKEMMAYVSPGIWVLYRLLVPFTNLYVASKWVQALALGILVAAGCILARSRRGGLAGATLLVYLVLSDSYAIGRIAGGHARAFAFPCFALWVAGVVTARRWVRSAAPVLGALFYPAVTLMILAAEGTYVALDLVMASWRRALRHARGLALVAGVSLLATLPSVMGGDKTRGPIHTLAQAQAEPAFFQEGRLRVLPLGRPMQELSGAFLARFSPSATRWPTSKPGNATLVAACTAFSLVSLAYITQRRRGALLPQYFWSFLLGTCALYFVARWLAFRLYSTERYYAYAMRMASTLLLVTLGVRFHPRWHTTRNVARNLFASGLLLASWACLGDGIIGNNGMTIDARWDADLYRFIRTLPRASRFASHPMDGDGIPYYAARATIGTFETLQPWFVDSWRRQKAREMATLDALYASDFHSILDYGRQFQVDYVLVNDERYHDDWSAHTASFEPFTAYARQSTQAHPLASPALAHVPSLAVVFERRPWRIVDLKRLESTLQALSDGR